MGDGTAHVYNADTSELSFGWRQTTLPSTSGWFAIAVAFGAASLAVRHRHRPTADGHRRRQLATLALEGRSGAG
jgi:hypothetical protein